MQLNQLIDALSNNDLKPYDCNLVSEQAHWVFSSLKAQYSFIILLDDLLTGFGYVLSDPPDGDGAIHWDFKVELRVFKY
jgi:hypothetical protein